MAGVESSGIYEYRGDDGGRVCEVDHNEEKWEEQWCSTCWGSVDKVGGEEDVYKESIDVLCC